MDKTWVYGGLRVADGQAVTCTAASRTSVNYQRFLELVEAANPAGDILVITDNLSSHTSVATREWLAGHPRILGGGPSVSPPDSLPAAAQGRLPADQAKGPPANRESP